MTERKYKSGTEITWEDGITRLVMTDKELRAEVYSLRKDGMPLNFQRIHIEGEDLSEMDLSGIDLTESMFGGTLGASDLTRAVLNGVNFYGAQLRKAVLKETNLKGAVLAHADLSDAYLGYATMMRADLSGAVLKRANLEYANLNEADFDDADMAEAILKSTFLKGVRGLRKCDGLRTVVLMGPTVSREEMEIIEAARKGYRLVD